MLSLNLPIPSKPQKSAPTHPWARTIKDPNAHLISRAHNSINNLVYPKPKQRKRSEKRATFTVYGDRVTREFIYCANMVRSLYKYRWKDYDAPIIKGYTTAEWPMVLNELKLRYGKVVMCKQSQVFVLRNDKYLGTEVELRKLVGSQYYYHLALDYQKESVNNFANFIRASGRTCVYMHISVDSKPIGSLIFMLYTDICPITCENFVRLCCSKRGGYSGSPVHRIVKDGWIQCGGFGLKSVDMDCENFIVPHENRGVLGMANAGRHVDCSTQFYVLLQPSTYMMSRYTAFGQLIDGDETLKKIEQIKTYYEAPLANIIIYTAGVLNPDCRDITINKGVNQYIDMHIDDLVEIGTFFYAMLIENVYLEIAYRKLKRLESGEGEFEEDYDEGAFREVVDEYGNVTKKKIRRRKIKSKASSAPTKSADSNAGDANNDFDVDEYVYEPEEYEFPTVTPPGSANLPVAAQPYYLAFTDAPYPGEVDSNFDLKRFLQGDYCLATDVEYKFEKSIHHNLRLTKQSLKSNTVATIISSYYGGIQTIIFDSSSEDESSYESDADSDEEKEVQQYIETHVERVSFTGPKVRNIAKKAMKSNPIQDKGPNEKFTDDDVRMLRLALQDIKSREHKKVSIGVTPWETHTEIKRRQTGFPTDLAKIKTFQRDSSESDEEEEEEKIDDVTKNIPRVVSMKIPEPTKGTNPIHRRPTAFVRPEDLKQAKKDKAEEDAEVAEEEKEKKQGKVQISADAHVHKVKNTHTSATRHSCDIETARQSVLVRLLDDIADDDEEELPTLKGFKPHHDVAKKRDTLLINELPSNFLRKDTTTKVLLKATHEDSLTQIHTRSPQRLSRVDGDVSPELQHVPSSHGFRLSKVRPQLTVAEYKKLNEIKNKAMKKNETKAAPVTSQSNYTGSIRLPGDTPLYSPVLSMTEGLDTYHRKLTIDKTGTKKSVVHKDATEHLVHEKSASKRPKAPKDMTRVSILEEIAIRKLITEKDRKSLPGKYSH